MFKKGKSPNPGGQSPEALHAIRHIRRLMAGSLRDITLDDLKAIYRDEKSGKIIKTYLLEYLKMVLHYWPDGFIDPDAKPVNKDINIKVEVVAPLGKLGVHRMDKEQSLVTSTLEVKNG